MVDEKDIEYGKIFHRQLDVIKEQEKLLDHKDSTIKALVSLCLSNGIISRGLACTYLGCAREDLDDMLRVVEDGDAIPVAPAQTPETDPDS